MKQLIISRASAIIAFISQGKLDKLLLKGIQRLSYTVLSLLSKSIGFIVVNVWTRFVRVQPNRILFNTFQGVYCCNPKGITENFLENDKASPEIIWVIRPREENDIPKGVKSVYAGTFEFFYYLASSKIIVENTIGLQRLLYRKKKSQVIYQTWHGSLGIKRLDGPVVNGYKWKIRRWLANKETDYCISNSQFETDVFKSAYWPTVEILPYGHARNDILFSIGTSEAIQKTEKLKRRLGIEGKSTILMAPSHYDGKSDPVVDYNFSSIISAFKKRFGGEWIVLFRLHPRYMSSKMNSKINISEEVINVTSVCDMQDLLLIADAGITDFSSWIFDYLFTGKPGFILHQDKKFVDYERGLYFPFESTPFPIASSIEELLGNIATFDDSIYQEKREVFLEARGCVENGNASRRITQHMVDLISDARS
ncbi:CDP-glycerol glycerophosphotransferase family protein [Vibrio sp. SCSIO 43133]|uniref:CDP-glycerol glycerophosphotransferase family protein n=1 Tax=Vibrio sp. SCSIO 43133 TaxID=2802577 RepID=UPI0020763836|nr:CDP-glycerol glycerophosphotransferase family protein [Vibrio sp. SCSIO 43133]USE00336.1 CDP-glycerol glycerophosphotransferase family protein [Vibrio sp. SCSIO 43133]